MAVRPHLPRYPSCRRAVHETDPVLDRPAASPQQIDPPTGLRHEILTRAEQTPQATSTAHVAQRRERRPRTGGRRLLAAVAVVGVIAAGGLGAYTAQVRSQHDADVSRSRTLADIIVALGRPGVPHATLSTAAGRPVAAVVDSGGQRTMVTAGLAPNDPNTIYVVWGVTDAGPRPLGTFDVATAGTDVHPLDPAAPAHPDAGYAISLEPGRSAPTAPTSLVAGGPVET
jgi:hypothetical protein